MSNARRNKHLVEGAMPKTSLFKPLVSTSLAFALGVSVASADTYTLSGLDNTANNSNTPLSIVNDSSATGNISLSESSENANYYTFTSNGTAIGKLRFWYGATNSNISESDANAKYKINNGLNVVQINNATTTFSTNGKGLMMGMAGQWRGKLLISSNSANNRSFTLDLSNITDKTKYAFIGDLELEDGVGQTSVKFGGAGISGMIRVTGGNNSLTFTENANAGKLWFHKGTTTITFEKNATIRAGDPGSGTIYVGKSYIYNDKGVAGQTFIFNGDTNVIENTGGGPAIDLCADPTKSTFDNTYNRLIFKRGSNTITNMIRAQTSGDAQNTYKGKNLIVFKEGTTNNTINGNIYSAFGYNTIVFAGASNPDSTLDNLGTTTHNKLIGNITSKGLNQNSSGKLVNNLIYFKEDGYIEGNVSADSNPTGGYFYSRNMVVFEKKGYIKGNITGNGTNSWYNKNYLVFKDDAKIEGSVGNATNSILLSGANKTLTITGALQGNTKIWGTSTAPASISGTLNYSSDETYKTNVINFFNTTLDNNTLTGTINLNGGVSAGGNEVRADTLNINANTDGYAIKNSGGTNTFYAKSTATITGVINAGNGTNNIALLGFGATNTISNNISVSGNGRNAISFAGSLSIVGSSSITLTAQWGQNNITSSNGSNIILGNETNKVALKVYGNAATNVAQNNIATTGSITACFSTISTYDNNSNGNGYHKNIRLKIS